MAKKEKDFVVDAKLPTTERCNYCAYFDWRSKENKGHCLIQNRKVKRTNICPSFTYDWGDWTC